MSFPWGSHEFCPHGSLVVPRLYPHCGIPMVFVSGDPAGSLWDKLPTWFPWGSHEGPTSFSTWFPCGSQVVPTLCFTHPQLPMWFPWGSLQFTIWLPCGSQVVPHTDRWINVIQYSSKPSTFWLQQWKIFHKVQTITSSYFFELPHKPSFQMWPNKKVVAAS